MSDGQALWSRALQELGTPQKKVLGFRVNQHAQA